MPVFFFNKIEGLRPATLLKKSLWHTCFPVSFPKFQRTPFYIEHLMWLLLNVWLCSKNATKDFNKCLCEFNILSFSSRLVKYFFLFINFYFFQYSKRIFKFCCKRLIFIQTNIYVKTYTGMQISRCR